MSYKLLTLSWIKRLTSGCPTRLFRASLHRIFSHRSWILNNVLLLLIFHVRNTKLTLKHNTETFPLHRKKNQSKPNVRKYFAFLSWLSVCYAQDTVDFYYISVHDIFHFSTFYIRCGHQIKSVTEQKLRQDRLGKLRIKWNNIKFLWKFKENTILLVSIYSLEAPSANIVMDIVNNTWVVPHFFYCLVLLVNSNTHKDKATTTTRNDNDEKVMYPHWIPIKIWTYK